MITTASAASQMADPTRPATWIAGGSGVPRRRLRTPVARAYAIAMPSWTKQAIALPNTANTGVVYCASRRPVSGSITSLPYSADRITMKLSGKTSVKNAAIGVRQNSRSA